MLKKIRIALASVFFLGTTLLFLYFTGTVHAWLGWMAEIQFLPAFLALNVAVVAALVLLTLLLGRVYCSVICPLGILQDIFWSVGRKKHKVVYSPEIKWLRYGTFVMFAAALIAGIAPIVALLAPYSSFGRIASNLFAPLWQWGNNLLAYFAERMDSYAFYETEVWIKSMPTFVIAVATLIIIFVLARRGGRTYCNTVCPVGTILGVLAKYSLFKPVIDTSKCNGCGLCARNCKASCINAQAHAVDYSRCVACMDCIENCKRGAITYGIRRKNAAPKAANASSTAPDASKRKFLTLSALFATTAALKAQEKKVDGGLAVIEDKIAPQRKTSIVPAGSESIRHFAQHCTACQLCVSVCPNQVLRPSARLEALMQPEMSYELGYCRPECTKCSEVCPTDAIKPLTAADKSSVRIGHAVLIKENCISYTKRKRCGNCARHCPVGAIEMVDTGAEGSRPQRIPAINAERCIGCGACENLCPSRPFSAIYVEGHEVHSTM